MKLLRVSADGDKAQCVHLKGDRKNPEPEYLRVYIPFGSVDIVRCDDGSYWVHLVVNRTDDGGDPDRTMGTVLDGRFDLVGRAAMDVPAWPLDDPKLYHMAVRVGSAVPEPKKGKSK